MIPALILIGVGVLVFLKPELFHIRGVQVPVGVTVRPSAVGVGKVLQVTNTSDKILSNIVISAKSSREDQSVSYRIASLRPEQVQELGWMEWEWQPKPGDIIRITADGFLPIVFSSEQLGIR